jgi:hypothetical protein
MNLIIHLIESGCTLANPLLALLSPHYSQHKISGRRRASSTLRGGRFEKTSSFAFLVPRRLGQCLQVCKGLAWSDTTCACRWLEKQGINFLARSRVYKNSLARPRNHRFHALPSCRSLRNWTNNVINAGNPGAPVRSSLVLALGTQFNRWRSKIRKSPCPRHA